MMSDSIGTGSRANRWLRLAPWLIVSGILLFHAINNWIWLSENVTSTGWDEPRHLTYSVHYGRLLSSVNPRSLFEMMASDPIRPPLFAASTAPLSRLFGWSADVVTMINVVYMLVLLLATYGIGRRWRGRNLGLVSVALLACFPMFYSMSRHFYLEFALTAMVALSVYLLLATDGFQRKGATLLFGLSLGLGLLTKRTFVVFVVGPVLIVVLNSGLLPQLWQRLKQRPRLYWKRALLAVIGGLAVAALWYLPNREAVQSLFLGDALLFLWWMLAAFALYFALLPSAPLANALSALFVAGGVASTWYLIHLDFVQRVALYGYGIDDPRGRTLQLGSLDTYLFYLRRLGNEHVSFILWALLVVVLVAAVVVVLRRQGSVRRALRQVRPEGWAILAWLGGAYVLLTFSIYHESRALTPVLPAVALIFGAALLTLPWRRLRLGILALVLLFGTVQFFASSYEAVSEKLPPRTFTLPLWGQTSSFATGGYIQLPDEGLTDRNYWIEPAVLQRMEDRRLALGKESLTFGLLANSRQINAGAFGYLVLAHYPQLQMESLVDDFDEASSWHRVFAHDYVVMERTNAGPEREAIQTFVDSPPRLFTQAFEVETSYPLPDGDVVYLYRQRFPLPADTPPEYIFSLAEQLTGRTRAGDAILLTAPELLAPLLSHYTGPAEISLVPETEQELGKIAAQHARIFLVIDDLPDQEAQTWVQDWLNRYGFWAAHEWVGGLQLFTYGTVAGSPATVPAVDVSAIVGDQIELVGYDLPASDWQPGDILPLSLFWQPSAGMTAEYRVFVHLLDTDGQIVAQTDTAPAGGSRPTASWAAGEVIRDPVGILLPPALAEGEYRLVVGMYDPDTGERLPVVLDEPAEPFTGDSIPLEAIRVTQP
jgi:4-amino-4-deoxy-L-arabinose transferase-like glycosyltransferase